LGIFASTVILVICVQAHEYPVTIEYGVLGVLAAFAMALTLIFPAGIYETARQIERFDDYEAEFEARWGSINEEQPKAEG
jgi:hypothetical protein